jgi:competence protein ComEC
MADSTQLSGLRIGDLVEARGRLNSASETALIGVGGLVSVLSRFEVASVHADSNEVVAIASPGYTLRRGVSDFRNWIIAEFDRSLGPDAAALCKALVLGDRGDFSAEFSRSLRITGLSHVFALSGMNVGVLISLIWVLLGALMIPHVPRLWILLAVVLIYMELGLEAASLVRASLMAAFYLLGKLLYRRVEILNSIAAAAFVEILWRPLDLIDAGFILSYLAVLGIITGSNQIRQQLFSRIGLGSPRSMRVAADVISVTVATQIATTIAVGFMFHRMPLVSALGNVVAVPGFAILLLWSVALLITAAIVPPLAVLMSPALDSSAFLLGKFVAWLSAMPLAAAELPAISLLIVIAVYGGIGDRKSVV